MLRAAHSRHQSIKSIGGTSVASLLLSGKGCILGNDFKTLTKVKMIGFILKQHRRSLAVPSRDAA
jgi:hypothetical protein